MLLRSSSRKAVTVGIFSCLTAISTFAQTVDIKILAINDFHGQITTGQKVSGHPVGGAAVLSSYLESEIAGWENRTVLLSVGDLVGASPAESGLLQDEPSVMMLNYLEAKVPVVATIGNHELDEGIPELNRLFNGGNYAKGPFLENPWKGARFPLINGNLIDTSFGFPVELPYYIMQIPGSTKKIAFIGVTLKETPTIVSASAVAGLKCIPEPDAINHYVKELQKLYNIHAFVILLHQGGSQSSYNGWTDSTKSPSADIANLVSGLDDDVDIVCTAHSHNFTNAIVKNNHGHPMLLTQAYSKGTAYADIIATVDVNTGDIIQKKAQIITTYGDAGAGLSPDPTIASGVDACKKMVLPLTSQVVNYSPVKISASQNAAGESVLGDLIADAQRSTMHTDFAFMNPGGIRADIDSGNITWGNLFTVQPFANLMVTMTMTGQQIYDVLNQQWLGQAYTKMLQISGLTYTWSSSLPVGNRIVEIRKDGVPISKTATYTVTCNNFLSGGGDGFLAFKSGLNQVIGPVDLDVLVDYMKALPSPVTVQGFGRITVQ